MLAVGSLASNTKESVFGVWVSSILINSYHFRPLSVSYSPNSILGVDCRASDVNRVECVMSLLGGSIKKLDMMVKDGNYEVREYANYKSYLDYQPIQITFTDRFFVSYAFSPSTLSYGLIVYNSNNTESIFMHSFIKLPFTIGNNMENFRFGLYKKDEKSSLLTFINLDSVGKIWVFEVQKLCLLLSKNLNDIKTGNSLRILVNGGDLDFSLNDVLIRGGTGIKIGQIILVIIIISSVLVLVCALFFIFQVRQSQNEKNIEDEEFLEEEKKRIEQEIFERLNHEQRIVVERQKMGLVIQREEGDRDSVDTVGGLIEKFIC